MKEFLGKGTLAEGQVAQVKIVKATQLEAADDASVICFIDQSSLKQLQVKKFTQEPIPLILGLELPNSRG